MLVARLPNVKVLNGGDMISKTEREDSERAFIRYFLDTPEQARPERWQELVEVHGILDPLVNIDLSPDMSVKVSQTNPSLVRKVSIFLFFLGLHLFQRSMPGRKDLCTSDGQTVQANSARLLRFGPSQYETVVLRPGDDEDCWTRGNEVHQQGALHLQRH